MWYKYYCWTAIIIDCFITVVPRIFDGVWGCTMQTESDAKSSEQKLILSPETQLFLGLDYWGLFTDFVSCLICKTKPKSKVKLTMEILLSLFNTLRREALRN